MISLQEFDDLINRVSIHASDKERNFLDSAREFYLTKGKLTPGQQSWIDSISDKYSPEKIAEAVLWQQSWSEENRSVARKVAKYYEANPPYFSNYVARINAEPETFFLSKKEWDKLCENKYAKKILKEYDSPARFNVGQTVQIRANNKVRRANYDRSLGRIAQRVGFVLEVNALPITRAAKGSKIYKVLLAGETSPIFCHEADLKFKRG